MLLLHLLAIALLVCLGTVPAYGDDSVPAPVTAANPGYSKPSTQAAAVSRELSVSERFNARLPSWLQFSGEVRERVEGFSGGGFRPGTSESYDLHRFRLGVALQPFHWLRAFAQVQDARVWGKDPALPPYQNTWDLRQAYLQIGDPEAVGLSVRAGRQELNFGNGRLIGESWWTNISRSFDGVRGTFQREKYRVDAFATSVVISRDGVIDHHNQGNNLHGLYGSFQNLIPRSTLEAYTLWHVQNGIATEEGTPGHLNQHTHGVRAIGALPAHLDYRAEMAIQRGTLGSDRISAWTGHWLIGGTLPKSGARPRLFVEYNYASGDRAGRDGVTNTFDPLYPSTHDKMGLADQFGWRNIQNVRLGAEFRVHAKWVLATSVHDFWLADRRDALYAARGPVVARSSDGTAGTHVGEEFDVQAVYKPTPQTQFGFGYGHVFTGEFLNKTTKGKDFNFPYALFEYVF